MRCSSVKYHFRRASGFPEANATKKPREEVSRDAYHPELLKFALTLQLYSTKAYEYVRKQFGFTTCCNHSSMVFSY